MRMLRTSLRWFVLACSLALLLSCVALSAQAWALAPPSHDELYAHAQTRWADRPFSRYRLVLEERYGESQPHCRQEVEVADEQVVSVMRNSCGRRVQTVTDLFTRIARGSATTMLCSSANCACLSGLAIQVTYDSELGYPHEVRFQPQRATNWRGEGYWRYLIEHGRLPSCSGATSPKIISIVSLTPIVASS